MTDGRTVDAIVNDGAGQLLGQVTEHPRRRRIDEGRNPQVVDAEDTLGGGDQEQAFALFGMTQGDLRLKVVEHNGGQVRRGGDDLALPRRRLTRLAVVDGEGAEDPPGTPPNGVRPAGTKVGGQEDLAHAGPVGVAADILADHERILVDGARAGTEAGTDHAPVQGPGRG
jgi:hypothetical protein